MALDLRKVSTNKNEFSSGNDFACPSRRVCSAHVFRVEG